MAFLDLVRRKWYFYGKNTIIGNLLYRTCLLVRNIMTDVNANSEVNISSNKDSKGMATGYIHGNTFKNKEVKFKKINGMAIFEGDIILASTPEEMERLSPKKPSFDKKIFVKAVARTGEQFRWPRGEIPYEIRSSVPNQNRITDAIYHWEERTHIRFIPRTKLQCQILSKLCIIYPIHTTAWRKAGRGLSLFIANRHAGIGRTVCCCF